MKQLTTELAFTIASIIMIGLTIGGMFYLGFVSTVAPDQAPATAAYNVGVIANELGQKPDQANVFLKLTTLNVEPTPTPGAPTTVYQSGDLGKNSLIQPGQ